MKKPTVAERRKEILEVTCEVVIDRGFAATRIADVAKRLGISSSLVHYHFDSKEQLLAEAFAHYARKELAELEADIESAPTSVEQLDRALVNSVPEGSDDMEWMLWIDGWGEALRNPMMRTISQELDEQSARVLEQVIRLGVERGEFACGDPAAAALRLTAVIDGLAVQFAAHEGVMDREQLIDHVRTLAAWEVGLEPDALRHPGAHALSGPDVVTPATDTALHQLISRYCDAATRRDDEEFARVWTHDAVWNVDGKAIVGLEAIMAAKDRFVKGLKWFVQTAPNAVFEVDEANGTGRGRVMVVEQFKTTKGKVGTLVGTYHDTYRRTDGAWRFAERRMEVIHSDD